MAIHHTALVHPSVELGEDVQIGPYSVIGEGVRIGSGTRIAHHVTIEGPTGIGKNNIIFPYAYLGGAPQDVTYRGEKTRLRIGDGNTFREFVTVNRGTLKGDGITIIGSNNLLMAYCHVAHDCILEDGIVMANGVQLGGHVKIESDVTFGGLAAVHHFVTVGEKAFVGGLTRVVHDVPPFMTVEGNPSKVRCVNTVGLRRRGFSEEKIQAIKDAFQLIYRSSLPVPRAMELLSQQARFEEIKKLVGFYHNMKAGRYGRARELLRKPAGAQGQ
jgi:UDP-N-acetylglucosamine acyltransferase